jgi:voltage-gated potassium channel
MICSLNSIRQQGSNSASFGFCFQKFQFFEFVSNLRLRCKELRTPQLSAFQEKDHRCPIPGGSDSDGQFKAALKQAQIARAKGLISALTTDQENIYTVLTARYLNKDLYIVSRAIEPHAHEKLTMAGADRTVSPNAIGGRRMAAMMVKPSIFSFLDIVTYAGEDVLNLEEVELNKDSELIGKHIGEAEIPKRTGLLVMAIKKGRTGAFLFNPGADVLLELGDSMIVLGDPEKVNLLNDLARDTNAARAHEHV